MTCFPSFPFSHRAAGYPRDFTNCTATWTALSLAAGAGTAAQRDFDVFPTASACVSEKCSKEKQHYAKDFGKPFNSEKDKHKEGVIWIGWMINIALLRS